MLFNSFEFLWLLAITVILYYLPIPARWRKVWQVGVLLVASAIFYAWEKPELLILLTLSCVVNTVAVERILWWKNQERPRPEGVEGPWREEGIPADSRGQRMARRWLVWTVTLNLVALAVFKYAGFFAGLLPAGWLSPEAVDWLRAIPLPVGISFYTFQGISLVIDVWRRDVSAHTERMLTGSGGQRFSAIRDTSFYIVFFPQLVAGPIVKAHEFIDQIGSKVMGQIDWKVVRRCLVAGYFLKIVVADNLAEQTAFLSTGAEALLKSTPINLMSLLYGYSLQIFADFAGYSLIAIGLGALFGYKLPDNFHFPYLSRSITEFWRRWHLSLSAWLRDYLYIPLGGNRKGSGRTYFNLFLVMFLGGLWHGAAWKFALWGSLHGIFLAVERFLGRRSKVDNRDGGSWWKALVGGVLTFHLVTFLWLTFLMPDMASIRAFFEGLATGKTGFSGPPVFSLAFYGGAVVVYHLWGWLKEHRPRVAESLLESPLEAVMHGVMVFLVVTNPGAPQGFIYFQF